MRRVLLALLTAAALATALVTLPALPASGEVLGTYDASVAVTDVLGEIAPAGNYGLYDVTVTLAGPAAGDVVLSTTAAGGNVDPAYSDCIGADGTCTVSLSPSIASPDSATFRVAVLSDLDATAVDFTATVSLADANTVGVDVDPSNDSGTVSTPVDQDPVNNSAAFVPEGGSLSFSANGQTHVLTVTVAEGEGGGAIVRMSDPGLMACGSDPCNGVRIEFDEGDEGEAHEAETEVDSTGDHDPCRGLGTDKCTAIFWRKAPTEQLRKLAACGTEAPDEPCLRTKYKTDPDGAIHYVTEMDTTDPDLGLPDIPVST